MKNQKKWMILFFICCILLLSRLFFNDINSITGSFNLIDSKYEGNEVQLDIYVMSMDPYTIQTENTLVNILEQLGNAVKLNVYFIGDVIRKNQFNSLHGQDEVEEDMRQACIQKYHKTEYIYYLSCINKDINNAKNNWEMCAGKKNIDIMTIKRCMAGEDGKLLLTESFKKSIKQGIRNSPTIILNKKKLERKDYSSLKKKLCDSLNNHPRC